MHIVDLQTTEILKLAVRIMHGMNNVKLKHHLQAVRWTSGRCGTFLVFDRSVATMQRIYLYKN